MKKNDSLNILHLTDSFNVCCGRSRHIALLAQQLQKHGYHITVVAGEGDGQYLFRESDIKIKFYPFLLHRKRSWFNFVRGIFLLVLLQRKYRFNLIHVHCYYQSAMVRFLTKWYRVPHLETVHGEYQKGKLPLFNGDALIAVSNQTKRWIVQEAPHLVQTITTIPYGIVTERNLSVSPSNVRASLGITHAEFIVSIIGRIARPKGHKILLQAISNMATDIPIVCLIVGEGTDSDEIRKLADKSNIRTIFTGTVNDPSVYYVISDVVVLPSLAYEGLPITILEAGKWGKAVIVSRINGLIDLIVHEKNGLFIEPGDVEQLARYLERLYYDVNYREKIGRQLLADITQHYSLELMTQRTLEVYKSLLFDQTHGSKNACH